MTDNISYKTIVQTDGHDRFTLGHGESHPNDLPEISLSPDNTSSMWLNANGVSVNISINDGIPTISIKNTDEMDEINVKIIGVSSALGDPVTNLTFYK